MVEKNPTPNKIIEEVNRIDSELSTASSNASNALSVANSASSNASSALTTANNANTTANSANNTANNANTTANNALNKANTATNTANTALQNSTTALNTANDAIDTAEEALKQVTEGTGTKVYSNNVLLSIFDADTKADANDVPTALSQLTSDSTHRLVTDSEKTTWNNKSNFSGSYADLTNKPTIPTALSQLSGDSTHRVVSDTQISNWNSKLSSSDLDYKTIVFNVELYEYSKNNTVYYVPSINGELGISIYNAYFSGKSVILRNDNRLWSIQYANKNSTKHFLSLSSSTYTISYEFDSNSSAGYAISSLKPYLDTLEIYPIGAIYLTINTTSPASLFGGIWTQISEGYALWTATSGGGGTIGAGLPNITGTVRAASGYGIIASSDSTGGAFVVGSANSRGVTGGSSNSKYDVNFNASYSNNIYGNSTTVQPPAYRVYAWRRTV